MSDRGTVKITRPWARPGVPNPHPDRSFGGLYRTAEHEERGETFGGIPLQTAEDAVIAALRTGYRVADEQVERGRRIASRLRGAAERAGSDGLGDAVDGVEQLITKLVQSGLQFVEEAVRDPRHPIRRLASAELSLLGQLLGLRLASTERPADPRQSPAAEPESTAAGGSGAGRAGSSPVDRRAESIRVRHLDASVARAVRVVKWDVERESVYDGAVVIFHCLDVDADVEPMRATLERRDGQTLLCVNAQRTNRAGRWRAAVLDPQRVQVGSIEIEL